ncbi:MAG: copper amine oxidase N-terminal domain-containing protein, partial [Armatimonadia bacterium]
MRRNTMLLLIVVAVCGSSALWADSLTLAGETGLALQLTADSMLRNSGAGAVVKGSVSLTPLEPVKGGLTCTFYVDDTVKLVSARPRPELTVNTRELGDGLHAVRVDVLDGTKLALSTGQLPLHVVNDAVLNPLLKQGGGGENAGLVKLRRKVLLHEAVFFDNREADLEKHAWMSGGRLNITLTDLVRHTGGTIIWGPSEQYIRVERNGITIRVIPGSARVYVNGQKRSLGQAARRIDGRTYVPIRPMLALLGVEKTHWNR